MLVNAARPRKREVDRKTKKTKRKAFRKSVDGTVVDFRSLIKCIEAKCDEVNIGLVGDKAVSLVARDISEKPSETI